MSLLIKISIITPVYNGEHFIKECIENVISQHCPVVEHIILDGCSTDGTVDVVKDYAKHFSHIRWISERDNGQSDAMNKGISLAKGTVVGFLNVDDFYEPNVLNKIEDIFTKLPEPSLLVGNCNVWSNEGGLLYVNKPRKLKLHQLLLGYATNPWPVNPSAYFYHKSLHDKIGLYKVEEHYALDVDFILKAVQVAHVLYSDQTLGNYRLLDGTKTVLDQKNGDSDKRTAKMLRSYRKDLPLLSQMTFGSYCVFARDIPLFIKWVTVVVKKYYRKYITIKIFAQHN